MTFRTLSLMLASVAMLGLPAMAQDTTAPAKPEAQAPATPAPAATPESAPKADAAEEPAAAKENDQNFPVAEAEKPREVLKEKFDDWEVRCAASDESRCFLYQIVKDSEGRGIAEFTLIHLPDGGQAAAGATMVTPLGVMLTRGVGLTIDSAQPLGYPFLYCAQSGCFSRLGLTAATITRMKKGAVAKVTIYGVNNPEQAVEGNLSLKGFTAAMAALGG
ncbi:invasion associated locus B family protein [Paroceanicella profunda]|uniref:Invasion associated locus B family protein n=1 Tax=Paroceanicella profunda TaxID=2579971 RepID=A0A5B8FI61_9RHOB|nr:invasion associated locus B family protein [Paroceanicella profunda]QDL92917.1 invasion associated locus B family protein [Paroceanicella profunda]